MAHHFTDRTPGTGNPIQVVFRPATQLASLTQRLSLIWSANQSTSLLDKSFSMSQFYSQSTNWLTNLSVLQYVSQLFSHQISSPISHLVIESATNSVSQLLGPSLARQPLSLLVSQVESALFSLAVNQPD